MPIDRTNWLILDELQSNARQSFAEIGRKVGLTSPAVAERVKKMEDMGVIKGYKAPGFLSQNRTPIKSCDHASCFHGETKTFSRKGKRI